MCTNRGVTSWNRKRHFFSLNVRVRVRVCILTACVDCYRFRPEEYVALLFAAEARIGPLALDRAIQRALFSLILPALMPTCPIMMFALPSLLISFHLGIMVLEP